ncbi:Arginine biosynthesis bifunctional protein ArgJ [Mucisphaera calidilacus]|uniref:Arginine biosynthesis bifunctional protein ArgJ n=2 Tax=Mucisphaera calidilacus TaxID=2527982 RepID=A0A518BY23_9BACT|nr:Arginine biosynthesis bifunctional protein ArgJ [Mucisphaera calidilacus]
MCAMVAERLGCKPTEVLVASTGVIGPRLPMDKIERGIASAVAELRPSKAAMMYAAEAILTTDTRSKTYGVRSNGVTLGGMAKGSGMIAPDMATMLGFLVTDARLQPDRVRRLLRSACDQSFNRISVDSDTSTSDMVLMLASGAARSAVAADDVDACCSSLSQQVLCDGEGTTRVFDVRIEGARSVAEADRVGRAIVNSPLVKTAVHGGDPNWGRFMMAVGKSGVAINPAKVSLSVGSPRGIALLSLGEPVVLNTKQQARVERLMRADRVGFVVDLGRGDVGVTWSGSDLSYEYVRINAEYTT